MKENVAVSRLFYPSLALCNNKRIKEIQTQKHQYSAKLCQPFQFTAVTTNTRPQRVFSSVQTCVLVDVNQPLPWFFTRWAREDSFSVSWALGRICRRFSRFCNILPQDLTPLHVKITRRKNLLSVSRRKLKLSTYLHTVSDNHISFLNRSQLVWVLASSGFY